MLKYHAGHNISVINEENDGSEFDDDQESFLAKSTKLIKITHKPQKQGSGNHFVSQKSALKLGDHDSGVISPQELDLELQGVSQPSNFIMEKKVTSIIVESPNASSSDVDHHARQVLYYRKNSIVGIRSSVKCVLPASEQKL